jgi:hypothetical protein
LSSGRFGFGGYVTWRMKLVNAFMSASEIGALRPSRSANAPRNFMNAACSSNVPRSGCTLGASLPPVRSPRQCIGPWLAIPRRLCVVIGPSIGWNTGSIIWPVIRLSRALENGPGSASISPSGLPRSQARLSRSPNTWQVAHDESPRLDDREAS